MGDDSSDFIPPELRVERDLEITIKNLKSGADHQRLQEALVGVAGVESVSLWEDKVEVRYDPERVTQHRLHELIVAEGFSIGQEDSASPMPSVEPL